MEYRLLGQTGLYVSELCLGTMTFGSQGFWKAIGEVGGEAVTDFLRTAHEAGVNFIDTANIYHQGESEQLLGKALRESGIPRHRWVLATKVRGRMGAGPNDVGLTRHHILNELDRSLERLQVEHIDLYQVHGFDHLTPLEETLRALEDAVTQGKVRYLGLCNFAAWQTMKALEISRRMGWNRFQSVQMFYSAAARDLEREVVPMAQDQGLSILPWSPLAGGLLSGKYRRDQAPSEPTRRQSFDFPPVDKARAFEVIEALAQVAEARGASIAQVALKWLTQRPGVTSVIIGARTPAQLHSNLAAVDVALEPDDIERIDAASALAPEYPGWMLDRQQRDRVPGAEVM